MKEMKIDYPISIEDIKQYLEEGYVVNVCHEYLKSDPELRRVLPELLDEDKYYFMRDPSIDCITFATINTILAKSGCVS